MNTPMMEAARQMPHMMSNMGQMMSHPMTGGAMLAAGGYAAGKGLMGGLLRNPLVFVAAGLAAGYLLHKYEKEIVETVSKATGMGKDFMLHQKENLDDLIAESQATSTTPATPAQGAQE
ncbi:hypothetical protein MASR1M60_23050 [Rhodocyclaceae bacterium]